ncbi:MAG: GNAT family N-acetyltransferase [Spirochaeta sp.]|nr:GNAT family N-acetyltransferase [Spirochaeta sp.]
MNDNTHTDQITIIRADTLADSTAPTMWEGARDVFWETAQQSTFSSAAEREAYCYRYFGYYRDAAPHWFFLAVEPPNALPPASAKPPHGRVLGYICGVGDTRAHPDLYRLAAHIPVFDDLYGRYPAHLHINLSADSRGHGLGGRLVGAMEDQVRSEGIPGVHLVTGPDARNVSFYRRNGFGDAYPRKSDPDRATADLLFLGKRVPA